MCINIIHIKIFSLLRLEEVTSILFRAQKNCMVLRGCLSNFSSEIVFDNHMLSYIDIIVWQPVNGHRSS